jgi:hypothetical protein
MTSSVCFASSRVGLRINAWTRRGVVSGPSSCRIGKTNAAVLPVPVLALAQTSRPARISGMTAAWIGVSSS